MIKLTDDMKKKKDLALTASPHNNDEDEEVAILFCKFN